ncbi:C3a anaphylatoxin chemotactic receptor-like [Aquarana catesbeiana]|uniref:C3a anaphylatoxin chemotactic receptor-like n=1 Tax=Aquarana catesbeiana TaxID=8400 RepID=UPI003CC9E873
MTNVTEDLAPATDQINPPVFSMIVMVLTFLVGVPGNLMVIWITTWNMKWTVNTIWFWNLALADVTCCLFLPLSIAQFFYEDWLYGPALCKVVPVIVHLTMFASVFTLVAISIDRCLLVVQPVWAQNKRSLRMAWVFCGVIWMLSFLMCLPALLHRKMFSHDNSSYCNYDINEQSHLNVEIDEHFDYDSNHSLLNYGTEEDSQLQCLLVKITYSRMVFGFLIPLLIVSTSYILLAFKIKNTRLFKVSRKTTKVALGIVVAFFVTWAPYHIVGVLQLYFHDQFLERLDELSVALAYFNSCINPILYVFMGKDMKGRVQQSVRRVMQNALSEELSRSTERTRSKLTTEDSQAL